MATLNTLRTRFGVVLSAVIAFALLAFIFSLKNEMGFSGNDPVVAQMDGQDITASEYSKEYNKIQRLSGVTEVGQEQADMLYTNTWQSLISNFVLQPGFKQMGIEVGKDERLAIISGEVPTQAMYSSFSNPSTGAYDLAAVNQFLLTSKGNPESEAVWAMINEQAQGERAGNKYLALVMAGINMNSLDLESGVDAANKSFAGRWARKDYSTIADSLVNVSSSEIKSYYEANKNIFKRQPTRNISYVKFNVDPSAADLEAIESDAKSVGEKFAAASDIRAFIRENRNGSVASNYVSEAQLPAAESEALLAGEMYGPSNVDNVWRMSRVYDSVDAADTLSIRHIVLPYSSKSVADSLLVALRNGADFAAAAAEYSVYTQTSQNGGDIGEVPFSAFADDYTAQLATAKVGDIIEVSSADVIQLMQIYDASGRSKHYKLASIDIPVLPSEVTRRDIHNTASEFVVAAKGGFDNFKAAADEASVSPLPASLAPSNRALAAVDGSYDVASWAHKAEKGDLSEIFKVDDGYLVAMLTGINDNEYQSLDEVNIIIKRKLANDKKFEMLKSELSGSTFDEISSKMNGETGEFDDVNFASYFATGIGVEPRVIGAIASTDATGAVSAPIMGNAGLFIFEVNDITESEEPQTAEAEKVRAEAMQQNMAQQLLFGAMEELSNIKDMRGATL